MRVPATVLIVLLLICTGNADDFDTLGYREDTVIQGNMGDQCIGSPIQNHDMSFENGYCWRNWGTQPPYYGAFGEAYELGEVNVECGLFYLTQIGYYIGRPMDVYIWDGGAAAAPSGVLCVVPGVSGMDIPFWPSCGLSEVEIGCCVTSDFTIGYWADFLGDICGWYVCADENGLGGISWTCIAPGIGYPTGWHPVSLIFPDCLSLGIGVTLTDEPSAPESPTWGSIKALFGE